MSTVTWLHLSDFHFQTPEQRSWDQNCVLRPLLIDVREQIMSAGLRPDFILVSGDIAFQGTPEEYALAQVFFDELLQAAELSKERLFVVPGNHDVDRSNITWGASAIAASINSRQVLAQVLNAEADRGLIFSRLKHYADFVNGYFEGHLTFDNKDYFYVREFGVGDLHVAVLGLNSAWLAVGGEEDRGRLALSELQVRKALEASREADLRIALLHHPFDWIKDFDVDACESLLMESCAFILHGHLHRTIVRQIKMPDAGAMVLAAGACYESREYPNRYHLVRLDSDNRKGTAYLRKYSDSRGGFWMADSEAFKHTSRGEVEFTLPLTSGGRPYRIKEKVLLYQYLDDQQMRQVKKHRIQALQDGVSRFQDRYKWTGLGKCTLKLKTPGASLVDLSKPGDLQRVYASTGPWDVYEVRFDPPLAAGEVHDVQVDWDLYDERRRALPFYSTTIDVPTDYLKMTVVLHKPPIAAKAMVFPAVAKTMVFPSTSGSEPVEVFDLEADPQTNTICWEIANPKLGYRYLITWTWRQ